MSMQDSSEMLLELEAENVSPKALVLVRRWVVAENALREALLSAEAHVHRLELISTNKLHVAAAKDWIWNNRELMRGLKGDG